ncbi:iron-sulfur cluster assembly scaffold protein [Mycoplasma sp. 613B]
MDANQKRKLIMDHYSNAKNKVAELPNWNNNYLHSSNCVDEIWLALNLQENTVIDAKFKGIGCAVFLSSADIFLDIIKNKTIIEIKEIIEIYKSLINQKKNVDNLEKIGNLVALNDVKTHLNRLECASMIYKVVLDNIESWVNKGK